VLSLLCVGAGAAEVQVKTGAHVAHKVTPIEKVMELLKKLEAKVRATGKKEAAQYDKFACFCKEQADGKLYAIEKSNKLITKLTAKSSDLGAELSALSTEIGKLGGKITHLDGKMKAEVRKRKRAHDGYVQVDNEVKFCISALEAAIKAMQNSKAQLNDVKLDFAQLSTVADRMRQAASVQKLSLLQKITQEPASYEYRSNDIIATLEELLATFKENKAELDKEEFDALAAHQSKMLNLGNQKKFAEKEKAEQQAISDAKTEEKAATDADNTAETNARDADQSFLDELTSTCQTKATEWDARSATRADELTVLSMAIAKLEEGAVPNEAANKKLVGLQVSAASGAKSKVAVQAVAPVPKATRKEQSKAQPKAISFLQLRGSSEAKAAATMNRALQLLSKAAYEQHSPMLSAIVLRAKAVDHFAKVREMIKDLVAKLRQDAADEQKMKGYCDTEMNAAMSLRDASKLTVEDKAANIEAKEAELAQTEEDIATLSQEIADAKKALFEATELRTENHADNVVQIRDSNEGKIAVNEALTILKNFYNEGGQVPTSFLGYTPPNAGRDGNTVSDLMPAPTTAAYTGDQAPAKNIIGILEVIESDFSRTETTTENTENTDESDYQSLKTDLESDISFKNNEVTTKEAHVVTLKDDIVDLTDERHTAEDSLAAAEKELETLKPMCVEGEETWDDRTAAREKEIEALKEAHDILENWKGF